MAKANFIFIYQNNLTHKNKKYVNNDIYENQYNGNKIIFRY